MSSNIKNNTTKIVRKEGGILRITAAILGGLFVAVSVTMVMAIYLPMPTNNRLALSGILVVPIWVAIAFPLLLTKSGWRSWLYCILIVAACFYPIWIGIKG